MIPPSMDVESWKFCSSGMLNLGSTVAENPMWMSSWYFWESFRKVTLRYGFSVFKQQAATSCNKLSVKFSACGCCFSCFSLVKHGWMGRYYSYLPKLTPWRKQKTMERPSQKRQPVPSQKNMFHLYLWKASIIEDVAQALELRFYLQDKGSVIDLVP